MNGLNIIRAARKVREAIRNEGPVPRYHRMVMDEHRQQWPTLWAALDELLAALDATDEGVTS